MESGSATIPVRSHRQAMDWSLVLVSQGIECTIVQLEDGAGWGLLVSVQDYSNALQTLRLYRLENRAWPWQQPVLKPGFLFDWGSLAWALVACLFYWLSAHSDLQSAGLMDGVAVARGQWWRLFTAMWLHGDLGHPAGPAPAGPGRGQLDLRRRTRNRRGRQRQRKQGDSGAAQLDLT